ncbi:hypothetical protein [Brevundimonas sp. Root1423]|uniref:hypothetical protein n=1 Tax=Brevundimonas sp. Root1423 TaxID=1736462 RepID=UPI0006FA8C86|nr:hypothetical protein [Brevundimonas sp. Root1423]KQY84792.1 hypothetical protein ASD25_07170 [Brevundimonas sp. Root1423]
MEGDDPIRIRLILGLDVFAEHRDFVLQPPLDSETMQHFGIPAPELDHNVRYWINEKFRKPIGLQPLLAGKITSATTFAKLLSFCKAGS